MGVQHQTPKALLLFFWRRPGDLNAFHTAVRTEDNTRAIRQLLAIQIAPMCLVADFTQRLCDFRTRRVVWEVRRSVGERSREATDKHKSEPSGVVHQS